MNTRDIARLFIRFHGLGFWFWAAIELTYIPPYYRLYKTIYEDDAFASEVTQDFWLSVIRITLQVMAGIILIAKTEQVIDFLASAQKQPEEKD